MMRPQGTGLEAELETPTRIRVYPGNAVERGACVVLNRNLGTGSEGPIYTETGVRANTAFANQVSMYGSTVDPSGDIYSDRVLAVALEPIAAGSFGWCAVSGLAWCKIDINTAGDRYAKWTTGVNGVLESQTTGPGHVYILYPLTGTGTKLCLCLITQFNREHYRLNSTTGYPGLVNTGQQDFIGRKGFEDGVYIFDKNDSTANAPVATWDIYSAADGVGFSHYRTDTIGTVGTGLFLKVDSAPKLITYELAANNVTHHVADGEIAYSISDDAGTYVGATDYFGTDTLGMQFVGGLYTGGIATGFMATGTTIDGGTW